jgi:hypothetical protein
MFFYVHISIPTNKPYLIIYVSKTEIAGLSKNILKKENNYII